MRDVSTSLTSTPLLEYMDEEHSDQVIFTLCVPPYVPHFTSSVNPVR